MDIFLLTDVDTSARIFKRLGFTISKHHGYVDAIYKDGINRYHIHFVQSGNQVYADFHYDNLLHLLFLGVDYINKPQMFFERKLKSALELNKIKYRIALSSWFHRKNRAIFRGLKI